MKGTMVMLDLMVALPIVALSVIMLFGCAYALQNGIASAASYQKAMLGRYAASQLVVSGASAVDGNYSSLMSLAASVGGELGVNVSVSAFTGATQCETSLEVCRIVTAGGDSYFMVVR